jgi:hypothetical protein
MKGTILQPTYLPWLGYFEMIDASEVFVVFDHVQFVRKSWQHRNRIKTAAGECLLSIPTARTARETAIADIEIARNPPNALAEHWKTITHAYQKAPFFRSYAEALEEPFRRDYVLLEDANVAIIRTLCSLLGITTRLVFSSKLELGEEPADKTERVVNLCRRAGLTTLYDALGAKAFLESGPFSRAGITVEFQNYIHPNYRQLFGEFLPFMSVIDLLFNEGDQSLSIIRSGRRPSITM